MEYTTFQNLPVVDESGVSALTVGDYFLFTDQEWQKTGVPLRRKIQYCQRISEEYPQGIFKTYRYVYDLLESDILTQETKTATRRGKNRVDTRDDDDARDIISETDWV